MLRWICGLLLLLSVNVVVLAHAPAASIAPTNLKSLRLDNVQLKGQTIGTLLSELSYTQIPLITVRSTINVLLIRLPINCNHTANRVRRECGTRG